MKLIVSLFLSLLAVGNATTLTPDNFDDVSAGKTAFIKVRATAPN